MNRRVSRRRQKVDNDCRGGRVSCLFHCLCSWTLQYLNRERDISSLLFLPWGGGQRAQESLSESVGFCLVCVAEIKVLAVASAGHHQILRGCRPNLTVVATRSVNFLNPRCGWGNWELSIETSPGGSDVAGKKLH